MNATSATNTLFSTLEPLLPVLGMIFGKSLEFVSDVRDQQAKDARREFRNKFKIALYQAGYG